MAVLRYGQMVTRQISLDEETDRSLRELAEDHAGDLGLTVAELVHSRAMLEQVAEASEAAHGSVLAVQVERAERQIRERRVVSWEELKRLNGL